MDIKQFWMVKGLGPTKFVHITRQSAEAEADRLARENPGRMFFVLETIAYHVRNDVRRVNRRRAHDPARDEELPF
jgi:hypothetical protein